MMTLDQVDAIRQQLIQEGASRPEIVRQLALNCMEWPYVFGAWGEQCSPSARKRRARSDHPTIVSKCPALNGKTCEVCKWGVGVRMYDCRGFTAWLIRQTGLDLAGQGATSQWKTAANWAAKGTIDTLPDAVCCLFCAKGSTMEHTGMHIGGGTVIHCSVNVQRASSSEKRWTHWAIPAGLYDEGAIPVTTVRPTLRRGAQGTLVVELQDLLNLLGYSVGKADGIFGIKTQNAVVQFQTDSGLNPDGIVGPKTWKALDVAECQMPVAPAPSVTYRVTAEGVTWEDYRRILEICPLAEAEIEG